MEIAQQPKRKSLVAQFFEALRSPEPVIYLPLHTLAGVEDVILLHNGELVSPLKLLSSSEPLLLEGTHTLSLRRVGSVLVVQLAKSTTGSEQKCRDESSQSSACAPLAIHGLFGQQCHSDSLGSDAVPNAKLTSPHDEG